MTDNELVAKAKEALEYSYSPYSHFAVGAALLSTDGQVFTGCNIENSSFGATNCAERTAIFKAVSEGVKDFGDCYCMFRRPACLSVWNMQTGDV